MRRYLPSILALLLLTGCQEATPPKPWQEISGREGLIIRTPLYRARVPLDWKRVDPKGSIVDTTLPIVEYWIENEVHITVHNFPSERLEERIPPMAQVARWRRQIGDLVPEEEMVKPVSHGGFAGYSFEAPGVMGWALQLDQEHYRVLSQRNSDPQMKADVTIKVVGPPHLCQIHRRDIIDFANSFELIQEIPTR